MPSRRTLVISLAAVVALAATGVRLLPVSAAGRYDRLRIGMTKAEVETAMGGPGATEQGNTTGKYQASQAEGDSDAPAGERRYWFLSGGMVVAEFAAGGSTLVRKRLLVSQ